MHSLQLLELLELDPHRLSFLGLLFAAARLRSRCARTSLLDLAKGRKELYDARHSGRLDVTDLQVEAWLRVLPPRRGLLHDRHGHLCELLDVLLLLVVVLWLLLVLLLLLVVVVLWLLLVLLILLLPRSRLAHRGGAHRHLTSVGNVERSARVSTVRCLRAALPSLPSFRVDDHGVLYQ